MEVAGLIGSSAEKRVNSLDLARISWGFIDERKPGRVPELSKKNLETEAETIGHCNIDVELVRFSRRAYLLVLFEQDCSKRACKINEKRANLKCAN